MLDIVDVIVIHIQSCVCWCLLAGVVTGVMATHSHLMLVFV